MISDNTEQEESIVGALPLHNSEFNTAIALYYAEHKLDLSVYESGSITPSTSRSFTFDLHEIYNLSESLEDEGEVEEKNNSDHNNKYIHCYKINEENAAADIGERIKECNDAINEAKSATIKESMDNTLKFLNVVPCTLPQTTPNTACYIILRFMQQSLEK